MRFKDVVIELTNDPRKKFENAGLIATGKIIKGRFAIQFRKDGKPVNIHAVSLESEWSEVYYTINRNESKTLSFGKDLEELFTDSFKGGCMFTTDRDITEMYPQIIVNYNKEYLNAMYGIEKLKQESKKYLVSEKVEGGTILKEVTKKEPELCFIEVEEMEKLIGLAYDYTSNARTDFINNNLSLITSRLSLLEYQHKIGIIDNNINYICNFKHLLDEEPEPEYTKDNLISDVEEMYGKGIINLARQCKVKKIEFVYNPLGKYYNFTKNKHIVTVTRDFITEPEPEPEPEPELICVNDMIEEVVYNNVNYNFDYIIHDDVLFYRTEEKENWQISYLYECDFSVKEYKVIDKTRNIIEYFEQTDSSVRRVR